MSESAASEEIKKFAAVVGAHNTSEPTSLLNLDFATLANETMAEVQELVEHAVGITTLTVATIRVSTEEGAPGLILHKGRAGAGNEISCLLKT